MAIHRLYIAPFSCFSNNGFKAWWCFNNEFLFANIHGKEMQVPDALSRIPKSSDNIGFESPYQDDPYFPYYSV
jgi:hypothetical protein